MKLAEALILRSDMQKNIEQLKERIFNNSIVQEGDTPGENPAELLEEFESSCADLSLLVQKINKTNSQNFLSSGASISDALAERDVLLMKSRFYQELAGHSTLSSKRMTRSEIKFVTTLKQKELQEHANKFGKEHRCLDMEIQSMNWKTDLVE